RMVDSEGHYLEAIYDVWGRMTAVSNDLSQGASYTYTRLGQLSTMTDVNGDVTEMDYDSLDRLTKTIYPGGKQVKLFYDSYGRMTKSGYSSDGSFVPSELVYNNTTGKMTKARFNYTG